MKIRAGARIGETLASVGNTLPVGLARKAPIYV